MGRVVKKFTASTPQGSVNAVSEVTTVRGRVKWTEAGRETRGDDVFVVFEGE